MAVRRVDGRGRQRWWDGRRWTDAVRYSGEEQSLAGIILDGRWIHFGVSSQQVAGARASVESGALLLKRGRLAKPAVARALIGPSGPITPHHLRRSVHEGSTYLLVELTDQVWLTAVPAGRDIEAQRFATWINNVSDHYRYR